MSKMVEFSEVDFNNFKTEYNKAVTDQRESFIFKGDEYLTSYAKYVIEYLTDKFQK